MDVIFYVLYERWDLICYKKQTKRYIGILELGLPTNVIGFDLQVFWTWYDIVGFCFVNLFGYLKFFVSLTLDLAALEPSI